MPNATSGTSVGVHRFCGTDLEFVANREVWHTPKYFTSSCNETKIKKVNIIYCIKLQNVSQMYVDVREELKLLIKTVDS